MTYKRFTYIPFDGFKDLDKELDAYEVLNLLNKLHEENQALRGDNKLGLDIYLEFYQENQKLQIEKNTIQKQMEKLEKENEQLKKEVEDLKQAVIRAAFGG